MSSTPVNSGPIQPVGPAPAKVTKVSWLKKLGQGFVKVFGIVAGIEKVAEVPLEALVPATIPGFAIFDKVASLVGIAETNAALVGQASNGPAKLQAVLTTTGQLLDQYVQDNFPGSADILKSETYIQGKVGVATQFVNTVVAFLNSLEVPATGGVVAPAVSAAAQAASMVAAANLLSTTKTAATPTTPAPAPLPNMVAAAPVAIPAATSVSNPNQ
jgi:hypothetical protein